MTKSIFICVFGGLGLSGACGSSDPLESTDPACSDPTGPHCSISVNAHSFVTSAGPATDGLEGGPALLRPPGAGHAARLSVLRS